MVCCGSKPVPSPRAPAVSAASSQGAEQQAAEQQARLLALQAEKIKLLEEQVASLRQVTSASSNGSTGTPVSDTAAARTPEPEPELPSPPVVTAPTVTRAPVSVALPEEDEAPPDAAAPEEDETPAEADDCGSEEGETPAEADDWGSPLAADEDAALTADEQVRHTDFAYQAVVHAR